ncbi:MAG: hypothetical protein AB1522_10790 [Chloroflexota bacterium]
MPFTDHSDLFGAVHEDGINRVVRHIMRQRPSLFNYATPFFHNHVEMFCAKFEVDDKVVKAKNPLFTEQEPLPILGAPVPIGLNFCLQLSEAAIDFHRGNVFDLPPELGRLSPQRFALRLKGCMGIDCPPKDLIDELVPLIERYLVSQQQLAVGETKERVPGVSTHFTPAATVAFEPERGRTRTIPLPTRELICFCLELYAVGYFEWGTVPGSAQIWLKTRLEGLEVVDIQPNEMESAIECYLITVLKLGILPRLIIPLEKMVLDITKEFREVGLTLGRDVLLQPSAVPADVPNNPAVEDDQIKAFLKLTVTGGA